MTKLYSFADHPDHKEQLGDWAKQWIANAMSTSAMDDAERDICRAAVAGLYAAAGLPAPRHIVFVPSPFVLRFAGGFAAARWYMHHQRSATRGATDGAIHGATHGATYGATYDATRGATYDATDGATDDATRGATYDATDGATHGATRGATHDATHGATYGATHGATHGATRGATYDATAGATYGATYDATYDATYGATHGATRGATRGATDGATRGATDGATHGATDGATHGATDGADLSNYWIFREDARAVADDVGVGAFGLACAQRAWNMWQGGNQWSAWDSFLSFFRHIAKLPIDYSKYEHWEALARHSGPRIVHPDFCMISDRPEVLLVDDQNRPHCENGPFCRWRDGSAIYAWHGTFVPALWIEHRDRVDPLNVLKAANVEQRAAGMAILGSRMIPALIKQKRAEWIDDSGSLDIGKLIEVTLPGLSQPGRYLVADCPRNGTIMEGVPLVSDIDGLPIDTALAAQAWRIGDPQSEYCHPPQRT